MSSFRLLLPLLLPLVVLASPLDEAGSEFQRGNYATASRLARTEILRTNYGDIDDRLIYYFVSGERKFSEIDWVLYRLWLSDQKRGGIFFNSVYLLLERALVLGENQSGIKWGKIFEKHGQNSKKYLEGLYLYACILHQSGQKEETERVLTVLETFPLPPQLSSLVAKLR